MISYLKGKLIEKTPVMVVIECSNIAFEFKIPLSTFEKLPSLGMSVQINVHVNVSDDGLKLYGFYSVQEKELFKLLITVTGIGPKLAVSILSAINWQTFIKHLSNDDEKALTAVPGLGKKTAQRLILELKDKIEKTSLLSISEKIEDSQLKIIKEAETALLTLGYKSLDIRPIIEECINNDNITTSEQLIKMVIKMMYSNKKRR